MTERHTPPMNAILALAVLGLLVAIALAGCGCVQKGAVQITIRADVQLDDVHGLTMQQGEQGQ